MCLAAAHNRTVLGRSSVSDLLAASSEPVEESDSSSDEETPLRPSPSPGHRAKDIRRDTRTASRKSHHQNRKKMLNGRGKLQGLITVRAASSTVVSTDTRIEERTSLARGGYTGSRKRGAAPSQWTVVEEVSGEGVRICDASGRKLGYRAWWGPVCAEMNDVLCAAEARLSELGVPPTYRKSKRGTSPMYVFSLTRGSSKDPHRGSWWKKHEDLYVEIKKIVEPTRRFAAGIFNREFMTMHTHYCEVNEFIMKKIPDAYPAFAPWSSFCLNVGGRVACLRHADEENWAAGLCLVIPFGQFDAKRSGKLCVVELGLEFEVSPGVPILFPSALYQHYNTLLEEMGVRSSLVAWTGGSIFQWYDLGGRPVNSLDPVERARYNSERPQRISDCTKFFPSI